MKCKYCNAKLNAPVNMGGKGRGHTKVIIAVCKNGHIQKLEWKRDTTLGKIEL